MSVGFPLHFWDSRAIWGIKAKMLYAEGTVFSPDFMHENRLHAHFRYPLTYPISMAFIYFGLGAADDWAVMLLVGLFFPFLLMFLYELIKRVCNDRLKALLGTAMIALLPLYYRADGPAHSGYADAPMALFYLVSFGILLLWRMTRNKNLLLLGITLSAVLPLVKNDGTMFMLLNLALVIWPEKGVFSLKSLAKRIVIFGMISGVVLVPWFVLRSNIPDLADEQYFSRLNIQILSENVKNIPTILRFYFRAFIGLQKAMTGGAFFWLGMWFIFAYSMVKAFKEREVLSIMIFWLIVFFLFFMTIIYMLAPGGPDTIKSNFFRICLSITPLLVIVIMRQLKTQ